MTMKQMLRHFSFIHLEGRAHKHRLPYEKIF